MEKPLRAQFYIRRTNGSNVPLFAADELPHQFNVDGNPRSLSIKDLDEDMIRVPGEYEPRHQLHQVTNINMRAPQSVSSLAKVPTHGHESSASSTSTNKDNTNQSSDLNNILQKKFYGIQEQPPSGTATTEYISKTHDDGDSHPIEVFGKFEPLPHWQTVPASTSLVAPKGKKVFCSHWMSTGECDYAQQGCLYKHEMPLDISILNMLGFQDIPKWYREKHGLGKLTAVPGSGAHIRGPSAISSDWRIRRLSDFSCPSRLQLQGSTTAAQTGRRVPALTQGQTPRTTRQPNYNLIDIDPQPAARASTPKATLGKSLLDSKYAPLPASQQASKSLVDRSPTQSLSGTETSISSMAVNKSVTANASAGSLHRSDSMGVKHVELKNSVSGTSNKESAQARDVALDRSSHHTSPTSSSRRSSIATDYETELTKELEERDAREAAAYAVSKAEFEAQKAQKLLNEAKQGLEALTVTTRSIQAPDVHGKGGRQNQKKVGRTRTSDRQRPSKKSGAETKERVNRPVSESTA